MVMRETPGSGVAHGQRFNVVGAAAEQRRHTRRDAGLVLDVNDKCMQLPPVFILAGFVDRRGRRIIA